MSMELIDFRTKIDEMTDAWLDYKHKETGIDRSELVRNYLHEIAAAEIGKATLLCNEMIRKGIVKDDKGKTTI